MAKGKKENIDMGDLESELDDVAIEAVVRAGGGGGKKVIPIEFANALKTKFDKDGTFAVPKEWLENKLGYDVDKPMKGRPNAVKRSLNRQHADIVGIGKIWHVGNNKDTHYLISVLDADQDEEDKWKKPKPKKEEEE